MGLPDVDLDIADRSAVMELFPNALIASQLSSDGDKLSPHNTGVYFQNLPIDPMNGLTTFPYDIAEDLGYFKIDFIPFHIYELVTNDDELSNLVEFAESNKFPWDWFQNEMFFGDDPQIRVAHIGGYQALCEQYPPASVMDVAILIALIRPRKKYLIGEPWEVIEELIWGKYPEEDTGKGSYFFKKSHAVGYALAVLVHMQLLFELTGDQDYG